MTAAWPARAVLIDLDGTLLDTVPDLTAAVNAMLAELGRAPIAAATVAAYIAKGAETLENSALNVALDCSADETSGSFHPQIKCGLAIFSVLTLRTRITLRTLSTIDTIYTIGAVGPVSAGVALEGLTIFAHTTKQIVVVSEDAVWPCFPNLER